MYCSDCGGASKPGDRFCHNCGGEMAASSRPQRGAGSASAPRSREKSGKRSRWIVPAAIAFAVLAVPSGVLALVILPADDGGRPSDNAVAPQTTPAPKPEPDYSSLGTDVMLAARRHGVFAEFHPTEPRSGWVAEYDATGNVTVRFDQDSYVIRYPFRKTHVGDDFAAVASRYGYPALSDTAHDELTKLEQASRQVLRQAYVHRFTVGMPKYGLAAGADALADRWSSWLDRFGEQDPRETRVARHQLATLTALATLATDPTQAKLDAFYGQSDALIAAFKLYDRSAK